MRTPVCLLISAFYLYLVAQAVGASDPMDKPCREFNHGVLAEIELGHLEEAEKALSDALANPSAAGLTPSCNWALNQNMAVVVSRSGRLDEAEHYAKRSIAALDVTFASDDVVYLRPLQVLSSSLLQQGKIAGARKVLQRMQQVKIELPLDRALLHGIGAAVLQAEGRPVEAEPEYLTTIAAWEEAGRGATSDFATALNGLADLYTTVRRFTEAARTLARVFAIYAAASDAGPQEQIRALNSRGVLYASQGQWRKAEHDLGSALLLIDRCESLGGFNATTLAPLLSNYAYVLHANHQSKEARLVESRIATLPVYTLVQSTVDVGQLLAESNRARK
jgi:tetratricopeptide (TPR) repeat protein